MGGGGGGGGGCGEVSADCILIALPSKQISALQSLCSIVMIWLNSNSRCP